MNRNEVLARITRYLESAGTDEAEELLRGLELAIPHDKPVLTQYSSKQEKLAGAEYMFKEANELLIKVREIYDSESLRFQPRGLGYEEASPEGGYDENWMSSDRNC